MPKFKSTFSKFYSYFHAQLFFILILNLKGIQGRYIQERSQYSDFNNNNNILKDSYLQAYYSNKWKNKFGSESTSQSVSKQDSGQVVPILSDLIPGIPPSEDSYLPDLGFIADFGTLVTRDFPASPIVRLSRDLFESEECAQFVSCEVSKFSRKYEPFEWLHNFLQDFPFKGDLADKLKSGSDTSVKADKCGYSCNPLSTLNRGLKMLNLLHDIIRITK